MTKENLVTGPSNISKDDAHRPLAQHKLRSCRSLTRKATRPA